MRVSRCRQIGSCDLLCLFADSSAAPIRNFARSARFGFINNLQTLFLYLHPKLLHNSICGGRFFVQFFLNILASKSCLTSHLTLRGHLARRQTALTTLLRSHLVCLSVCLLCSHLVADSELSADLLRRLHLQRSHHPLPHLLLPLLPVALEVNMVALLQRQSLLIALSEVKYRHL